MTALYLAGLALFAVLAVVDLAQVVRPWLYLLGAAGSACLLAAGAEALAGHTFAIDLGGFLGLGADKLIVDRLSGLFLVIAFGAAVPVSLALASRRRRPDPDMETATVAGDAGGRTLVRRARPDAPYGPRYGLAACYALTLGAVAVITAARDVFVFVFAWEALTIAFYLLAGFERNRPGRGSAALVTLVFGKAGGALLLFGFLLLADGSGSLSLGGFGSVPSGAARSAAYALLVLGFGTKVGLVPMQVWVARGYAAAPGPMRAIMAGVAVNVGFYGLWRTLALLGPPPGWLAAAVLLLAALTAVLGIAHAAVQTDLRRVIAYSSVENTGLILTGYGIGLVGATLDIPRLMAAGLLAGTLQIVAHTAAKSLLFTCAATFEATDGTSEMDDLRGAARRSRWSGLGFAVGAFTLAGLPPTVGFVSEWFLLEALMQQFRVPDLTFQLVLAVTGAAIALTTGFAAVTFVRLVGLVVLGPGRGGRVDHGVLGRVGIVVLCLGCLAVAAVTPLEIRAIGAGLSPARVSGALKSPWVVQPVFADFSILSPSWLWVVMPVLFGLVVVFTVAVSGARLFRVRRVPAWRSATAGVEGADCYTAFAYANPTRKVLANVLHTRTEVRRLDRRGIGGDAPTGARLGYVSDVAEVVEDYLYRPAARFVLVAVRLTKRLQSGRLDAYLGYMLIAFVAVLAVVAALV